MIFDEFSKFSEVIQPYYIELKRRLLIIIALFFLIFSTFLYHASFIWDCFFLNFNLSLKNVPIVIRSIGAGFFLTIKINFFLTLLIIIPIIIWQIWSFIKPACYENEKIVLKLKLITYSIYFIATQILNFIYVTPYLLNLLIDFNKHVALPMPDVDDIVSFALTMQLTAFLGVIAPILLVIAIDANWIRVEQLCKIRPYIYVFIFILAMFLTPPDVIAQCILAVPLIVLYEIILFLKKKRGTNEFN